MSDKIPAGVRGTEREGTEAEAAEAVEDAQRHDELHLPLLSPSDRREGDFDQRAAERLVDLGDV